MELSEIKNVLLMIWNWPETCGFNQFTNNFYHMFICVSMYITLLYLIGLWFGHLFTFYFFSATAISVVGALAMPTKKITQTLASSLAPNFVG